MKIPQQLTFFIVMMLYYSIVHGLSSDTSGQPWTWLYYRTLNEQETATQNDDIFFEKDDVPSFNQLVFSWNAFRPAKGYFSFWVQARDASTKKWGAWHQMMEWGAGVQRSFKNSSVGLSDYNFVRLDIKQGCLADGFRIRIATQEGAGLFLVRAFGVSLSNFNLFKHETIDKSLLGLSSVYIPNVPTISQFQVDHAKNDALCSPTSCSMLTSFLKGESVNVVDFARSSFDYGLGVHGSWPFNMAHAFECCKGSMLFFTGRLNSFARLHARLGSGMPVVVSVRGFLEGAASPYKHGHLLVVVGYDAKKQEVVCNDPAFKTTASVCHRYPLKGFLEAWERSRRLAYLAEMSG